MQKWKVFLGAAYIVEKKCRRGSLIWTSCFELKFTRISLRRTWWVYKSEYPRRDYSLDMDTICKSKTHIWNNSVITWLWWSSELPFALCDQYAYVCEWANTAYIFILKLSSCACGWIWGLTDRWESKRSNVRLQLSWNASQTLFNTSTSSTPPSPIFALMP